MLPSATATQYDLQNLKDGDNVCIEVRAVAATSNYVAASNDTCMQISIVAPVKYVYLRNASINPDNSVRLDWQWNNDSDMKMYDIRSGKGSGGLQTASSLSPVFPLTNANTINVQNEPVDNQKSYYEVAAADSCGVMTRSNYATTIFLEATPDEQLNNALKWSAYDNPYGTLQKYEVFRLVNGQLANRIASTSGEAHTDTANPQYEAEQDVCYYVLANAKLKFPDGSTGIAVSRSNTVCAHQNVKLYVPNAFVPDGKNATFKPYSVFTNSVDYYMAIFDRWGGRVFETKDIERGWDGTSGGQQLPQGTYTYYIKVKEADNSRAIVKQGTLTLIR